jgi:hypothetical protein
MTASCSRLGGLAGSRWNEPRGDRGEDSGLRCCRTPHPRRVLRCGGEVARQRACPRDGRQPALPCQPPGYPTVRPPILAALSLPPCGKGSRSCRAAGPPCGTLPLRRSSARGRCGSRTATSATAASPPWRRGLTAPRSEFSPFRTPRCSRRLCASRCPCRCTGRRYCAGNPSPLIRPRRRLIRSTGKRRSGASPTRR